MQKKIIRGKTNNTSSNKKIKPKISQQKKHSNQNNKNIKQRVSPKVTKSDRKAQLVVIALILISVLIFYLIYGMEIAIIAAVGVLLIVGFTLLLRQIKNQKKKRKIINFIIIFTLTIGILGIIAVGAFMMYIKNISDPIYEPSALNTKELTVLYNINDEEFAKLGTEQREKVTYEELPEVLVDAIVATEDSRFFQHNGFDAPRFIKAAVGQVLGSDAGGASTLTMQVVKNVFTDKTVDQGMAGIIRKFEDIYLSIFKLEKNYTKQEIIEFYVNNHFLGGNVYGVEEASQTYFGKSVSELNLSEAAIIAGMFKSPNYYRPNVNPENASNRRSTVLYLMVKHGYITQEEADIANSIPVESLTIVASASNNKYQGYIDTVVAEIEEKYGVNPYTTSLKIYTNLDTSKQDAVNSVFNGETYDWINDKVQAGVAVLDSQTGAILAIGNGRNIGSRTSSTLNQHNYATDIKRQPGSTAKPLFDYGPGIEYNNWSTYTLFDDSAYTYSNGQTIRNWDNGYFGTITLRRALSTSRNIPALKAFQQVSNKKIIEFVTNLGITPEIENGKIHEAHSIGAFTGTNPLEMAAAYAAFSNGGYYNEPYSVRKIEYRSTGDIEEHNSDNYVVKRKAMSDSTAFMITSVLQDVALTGGTPTNVACKTGTTNYDSATMSKYGLPSDAIRDSWVVGYSTKTVIGMWYGYDYIDSEYCLHNIPATIQKDKLFNALVNSGAMESNRSSFKQPSSVVKVAVASGSNPAKLAGPGTTNIVYEYFKKGYEPEEYDDSKLAAPSNFKAYYSELTEKVTLSWSAITVSGSYGDYGTFGYNIYKDGTLIDWTSKTSYTFETDDPYGTYKIVATYKSYSGIQSEAATFKLEKEVEKDDDDSDNTENNTGTETGTGTNTGNTSGTGTSSSGESTTPTTP